MTVTFEAAARYPIPGKPEAWGGRGGQPLGAQSTGVLVKIKAWARAQQKKSDGYPRSAELLANAHAVLLSRSVEGRPLAPSPSRDSGTGTRATVDLMEALRDSLRAAEKEAKRGRARPVNYGGEGIIPL